MLVKKFLFNLFVGVVGGLRKIKIMSLELRTVFVWTQALFLKAFGVGNRGIRPQFNIDAATTCLTSCRWSFNSALYRIFFACLPLWAKLKTLDSGLTMREQSGSKDQQHPLYNRDRPFIDILLAQESTDYNLAELARLRIRYLGFPGARDIQQGLDKVLQRWGLSEAELFEKTRQLHDVGGIYQSRGKKEEQDWN